MKYRYKIRSLSLKRKYKISETNFSISYKWEATESWEIDVKDLAKSLFSLWDLIDDVNKKVNWPNSAVNLKIKAFSKGSFVSDLSLFQDTIESGVLVGTLLSAQEILNLIFWDYGVIYFWELFKWQKIKETKNNSGGNLDVTLADNSVIANVSPVVVNLFWTVNVSNSVTNIVSPLGKNGIDEIKILQEWTELGGIQKQNYYDWLPKSIPEEENEKAVGTIENIIYLSLDTIVLSEVHRKWKFKKNEEIISANIQDFRFITAIENKTISFKSGDFIKARVLENTTKTGKDVLKTEFTILEIIKFNNEPFNPWLF